MTERTIEDIRAADAFVQTIIERADAWNGHAPLWHGWALMDAFFAGADYARAHNAHSNDVTREGE